VDISTRKVGQVQILKLRGAFRLGQGVDDFRAQTEGWLSEGLAQMVVNLAEVPMMDSSAIGVMVRLMTSCKSRGGAVKLVAPSKLVLQTLKMVGLINIFEIFEDDTAAVNSFGGVGAAAS
jgi:anti-sigma B factor antagonist